MKINATKAKRNVVLALQIDKASCSKSATRPEYPRILRISALFCDLDRITEVLYSGKDEFALLHRFWSELRRTDRIFSANVLEDIALMRARSWKLDVLPSLNIDLRCVYGIEMWDTEKMWTTGYIPHLPYRVHVDEPYSLVEVTHPNRHAS
jgi:hypothetical protein